MADFFDTKVAEFKKLFASSTGLVDGGQFAVTKTLTDKMHDDVTFEVFLNKAGPAAVNKALVDYRKKSTNSDYRLWANAALKAIKDAKLEASYPMATKLLTPDPQATTQWAAQQYGAVWTSSGMTSVPSGIEITADKIKVMFDYEADKCFRTSKAMGMKTVVAMGSKLAPNPQNYSGGQIANAAKTSSGSRDVVTYNSKALDAAVSNIVKAMSAGYAYVFGVLSGTQGSVTDPEHYILAFAQGSLNGKQAFLFWDPDAAVTNLKTRGWGQGFGLIFHADGHLSTGEDQSDFDNVDGDGDHVNNTDRHCYQVFLAAPSP